MTCFQLLLDERQHENSSGTDFIFIRIIRETDLYLWMAIYLLYCDNTLGIRSYIISRFKNNITFNYCDQSLVLNWDGNAEFEIFDS